MAASPAPEIARAVSWPRSSNTSPIATLAPPSTISRAVAAPMPRAAPEIKATLPSRRFIVSLLAHDPRFREHGYDAAPTAERDRKYEHRTPRSSRADRRRCPTHLRVLYAGAGDGGRHLWRRAHGAALWPAEDQPASR